MYYNVNLYAPSYSKFHENRYLILILFREMFEKKEKEEKNC